MATPDTPMPVPAAEPAPIGEIGRMTGVLVNPKPTYDDIVARPSWLAPLALLAILSIVVIAVFGQRVGWRSLVERRLAQNPQADQMKAEDRERALNFWSKYGTYIIGASGVFFLVLGTVITAGVLLGVFNLIAGTRLNYKTALAIVSFSWMPFAIHGLLSLILLFVKSPDTIDIEHLVTSNPGAILSSDSAKWLMALLTSLDIFAFWMLVLQAIGFAAASPKKVSFAKGLSIVVIVWAIWVLIRVGWVGAFS